MKDKAKGIHTIKFKIYSIVNGILAILVITLLATILPGILSDSKEVAQSYMLDSVVQTGYVVDAVIMDREDELWSQPDFMEKVLGNISISAYDTSYVYCTDITGKILYHPDEGKYGTQVSNEVINDVVKRFANGEDVLNQSIVEYVYNGESKYAAYYI